MLVVHNFHDARMLDIRALAIGFFDGLHPGHQQVIAAARAAGGDHTCVLSFWPHPRTLINPALAPTLLTGMPHKLRLWHAFGTPMLCLLPFDRQLETMSRETFMDQLQAALPRLETLAHGPNFYFAHRRQGSPQWLATWCGRNHCRHIVLPFASSSGRPLSSSRIRQAVQSADFPQVSELLGRPYSLYGRVVHGHGRGRQLGFPTINLQTLDTCLPPRGVYAGHARWDNGSTARAAINIGTQPTFHGQPAIEAHLLDTSGDWYGAHLEIEFHSRIRDEHRFATPRELAAQLARDVEIIRSLPLPLGEPG